MKLLRLFVLMIGLYAGVTGHIYAMDTEISEQNAQFATNFLLTFAIDTPLSEQNCLKIVFPFSLGYPSAMLSSIDSLSLSSQIQANVGNENTEFFCMRIQLSAMVYFRLNISADPLSLEIQEPGPKLPIKFYTVSSSNPNSIIYDLNSAFSTITLAQFPAPLIAKEVVNTDSTVKTVGSQMPIYFHITPSETAKNGGIFIISTKNPSFTFTSFCTTEGVECTADASNCENVTKVAAEKCNLQNDAIEFNHISPINKGQTIRIKGTLQYPSEYPPQKSTDISILQVSKTSNLILGRATLSEVGEVKKIQITFQKIRYFWGILPSVSGTNKNKYCPVGIYMPKNQGKIPIYNNILVSFQVDTSTPKNQLLRVRLELSNTISIYIVPGSIKFSMPVHSNESNLESQAFFDKDIVSGNITIDNIVNLQGYKDYTIGARVYIPFYNTFPIYNFGKVYINAMIDGLEFEFAIPSSPPPIYATDVTENSEEMNTVAKEQVHETTENDIFNYQQIISEPNDDPFNISKVLTKNKNSGIIFDSINPQRLIFLLYADNYSICLPKGVNCFNKSATTPRNVMLRIMFPSNIVNYTELTKGLEMHGSMFGIYSNSQMYSCRENIYPFNSTQSNETCAPPNTATISTDTNNLINEIYEEPKKLNNEGFLHVMFVCRNWIAEKLDRVSPCFLMRGRESDSNYGFFGLKNVIFLNSFQANSLYPDEKSFDFIICFREPILTPTDDTQISKENYYQGVVSASVVHAYTLNGFLTEARVSLINYHFQQASTSGAQNDNSNFPTMIRVGGYLPEVGSMTIEQRITIFLDETILLADMFKENKAEKGNFQISCAGTIPVICRSYGEQYEGVNVNSDTWPYLQRIDIISQSFQSNSYFDVFIPIAYSYKESEMIKSMFIGILQVNSDDKKFFDVKYVFKLYSDSFLNNRRQKLTITKTGTNWWTLPEPNTEIPDGSPETFKIPSCNNNIMIKNERNKTKINSIINLDIDATLFADDCIKPNYDIYWGSAFVMNSDMNFLDSFGKAIWTFDDGFGNNTCVKLEEKKDNNPKYALICTADYIDTNGMFGKPILLRLPNFLVPWNWGHNTPINIFYTWSSENGQLKVVKKETPIVNTSILSSISDWDDICVYTINQKISFEVYLYAPVILENYYETFEIVLTNPLYSDLNTNFNLLSANRCLFESENANLTCTFSILLDKIQYSFNHTNTDLNQKLTIDFKFKVSTWFDHTSPAIPFLYHNYTVALFEKGILLSESESSAKIKFKSCPGLMENESIILSDLKYNRNFGMRSEFSFKFTIPTLEDKIRIWDNTYLTFNLGFINVSNIHLISQLHCIVLDETGAISQLWTTMDIANISSLIVVTLYPNSCMNVNNYSQILENNDSSQSHTLKCEGIQLPGDSSNTMSITASFERNGTVIYKNTVGITPLTSQAIPMLSVTNTTIEGKKFVGTGFEADYLFKITPLNNTYDSASRIYVEFSHQIPPKFNAEGIVECLINGQPTYSEIISERHLMIWPAFSLPIYVSFYLEIRGILQPNELFIENYNQSIWIGIDNDTDFSNGICEQIMVNETVNLKNSLEVLPMRGISVLPNLIRSSAIYTFFVELPDMALKNSRNIEIEFSHYYVSLFNARQLEIACTVIKNNSHLVSNESYVNLAQSCNIYHGKYIQIVLNGDEDVDSKGFVEEIVLSNVPNPENSEVLIKGPRIFLTTNNDSEISHSTMIGYSYESSPLFSDWSGYYDLRWVNSNVEVCPYEEKQVTLSMNAICNATFSFLMSTQFQNFFFEPLNLKFLVGSFNTTFELSTTKEAPQGKYTLRFIQDADKTYSTPIPLLEAVVKEKKCRVDPSIKSNEVPLKGYSFPITFDFSNCLPTFGIQVNATIDPPILYFYGEERTDSINANKTLLFDGGITKTIQFIVYSLLSTMPPDSQTNISFIITGTDGEGYETPMSLTLELYDFASYNSVPITMLQEVYLGFGSNTFKFYCSHPGIIYFAISPEKMSLMNISIEKIQEKKNQTEENLQEEEKLREGQYEYTGEIGSEFTITKFFPLITYNIKFYCTNQLENTSLPVYFGWKQEDNNGRMVIISLTFKDIVSNAQKNVLACELAKEAGISTEYVWSDLFTECNLQNTPRADDLLRKFVDEGEDKTKKIETTVMLYVLPDDSSPADTLLEPLLSLLNNTKAFTNLVNNINQNIGIISCPQLPPFKSSSFEIASKETVQNPPKMSIVHPEINVSFFLYNDTANFSLTIQGRNGEIFAGLVIDLGYEIKTSHNLFRKGVYLENGFTTNFIKFEERHVKKNTKETFYTRNLTSAQSYFLFYYYSSDDPTTYARISPIYNYSFQSMSFSVNNTTVFGLRLQIGLVLMITAILLI